MGWSELPEPLLLSILGCLSHRDVTRAGASCQRWLQISRDSLLWRKLFARDWKLQNASKHLRSGALDWLSEYKRLLEDSPNVLSQTLEGHTDEVLHVSFSHDGKHFVTCSKDGLLIVWDIDQRAKAQARCQHNMRQKGWRFTWASRYNKDDSLLLVAGVIDEIKGEIAVFDTSDYCLKARVENNPYDVMGAWCDNDSWLTGRMSNPRDEDSQATVCVCRILEAPDIKSPSRRVERSNILKVRSPILDGTNYLRCLVISQRTNLPQSQESRAVFDTYEQFLQSRKIVQLEEQDPCPSQQRMLELGEYCLMFLCSDSTSIPHQIGFRRLYPEDLSYVPVISGPDRIIDLHGHIVGIGLAEDGRFLHVNLRRWPADSKPSEHQPPPIAQEIEMVVIDLVSLRVLPTLYTGHKGYTDSQGAFYIYLDVSPDLVASGSEDGIARVWDRHYCSEVSRLQHSKCVNCVAFSPVNQGILVSVSDDKTVKVWKSRAIHRKLEKRRLQLDEH